MKTEELIHDWNLDNADREGPIGAVTLDDETLRDGLQSPSVIDPPIDKKIEMIHLQDQLLGDRSPLAVAIPRLEGGVLVLSEGDEC